MRSAAIYAFGRLLPGWLLGFQGISTSFTVLGVPLAQDGAVVQLGAEMAISPTFDVSLGYDGDLSGTTQSHALRGGVRWAF